MKQIKSVRKAHKTTHTKKNRNHKINNLMKNGNSMNNEPKHMKSLEIEQKQEKFFSYIHIPSLVNL